MRSGNAYIDHVFMLVEPGEVAGVVRSLTDFGLTESSRRSHPGLGTSNVFFCFDNVFLEILWVADRAEASRTELGRLLIERVEGRMSGATPFGIAFRTLEPGDAVPFETWIFEPPAELGFKPIPIALSSRDRAQPLMFRAQRAARPDVWTDGKAGARQTLAGISEVSRIHFTPPMHVQPSADLQVLQDRQMIELNTRAHGPSLKLTLIHSSGAERELVLMSPIAEQL